MINDSDVGYFWDDQWNEEDETKQRNKRRETPSSDDQTKDDQPRSWGW